MSDSWYHDPVKLATVTYTLLTALLVLFMSRQTYLQRRLFKLQAFLMLMDRLEKIRNDRQALRDWIKAKTTATTPLPSRTTASGLPVPPDQTTVTESADKICRQYDLVGLLERTGFLDSRLLDQFYSPPFGILYHDYLKEYIEYKIAERGPTHFWELDKFAKRVQWVYKNHPGPRKRVRWPVFRYFRRREPADK
jgi:hypothetical protein